MVQVIPVHLAKLVPHGRDIDYPRPKPRRCRLPQQGEQTLGQEEVPEVVSLPGHLKPILCHIPVDVIHSQVLSLNLLHNSWNALATQYPSL